MASCRDKLNVNELFCYKHHMMLKILWQDLGDCCQSQRAFQRGWKGFGEYAVLYGANKVAIDSIYREGFCTEDTTVMMTFDLLASLKILKKDSVLPTSFLQDTLSWSRSRTRVETLTFHLDLTLSDPFVSWLLQSCSALWQNSRRHTGGKVAATAKTNTL